VKTYIFHVAIKGVPRVWRKIEISADQTLEALHLAIQSAFEFDNDHLYSFYMSGKAGDRTTEYCLPEDYNPFTTMPLEDPTAAVEKEDGETNVTDIEAEDNSAHPYVPSVDKILQMRVGENKSMTDEQRLVFENSVDVLQNTFAIPGNVLTATLEELNLQKGQKVAYIFDYGDYWHFTLRVHAINLDASSGDYPRVVKAAGKAPDQYDYGWNDTDEDSA